jgi:hypothetical protein
MMDEIPEDAMKAASEAFEGFRDMFYIGQSKHDAAVSARAGIEHIARAIMAERERCAKVAEDELIAAQEPWEHASPRDCLAYAAMTTRQVIAAAIRGNP